MIKTHKILEKIKLLLSSRAFKKNPLSTCFNVIFLFLLIFINKKKKISLKFGKNNFYFIIKNFSQGFGARGVFVFREYYEPLFEFGHNFLKDGDTILDIGANLGAYSIPIAKDIQSVNGQVIAFEPQRIIFYQFI